MKKLVVTSDDFGMCRAINEGILRAMREGVVRSTNFLVPCPWFRDALELALEHRLSAGIHLCLTCEWDRLRWGPVTRAASLMDKDGGFYSNFGELEKTARDEEIRAELEAQIQRVRSLGYEPTHFDSHMLGGGSQDAFARRIKDIIRDLAKTNGVRYTYDTKPDGSFVHFRAEHSISAASEADTWRALESWDQDGAYHLAGHAAVPSRELESLCSAGHGARSWAASYRVKDLEFFTSPLTRKRLQELGFELTDPRGLG